MPSPLAHTIAGLTVHVATARDEEELFDLRRAFVFVFAANAPDLDFLLNLFDGRNHHQQETHSVGFAALCALAGALLFRLWRWPRPFALGLSAGAAWLTHVVLDFLNSDTNPPIGLMALWPFSHEYYKFAWPLFLDIGRTFSWRTVRNNLLAAAWESVVLLPVLWLAWRLGRRRFLGSGR